ncbi:hypothetical protein IFHNHDMJ_00849 [Synechococcus sp. CBW1107]|nr:hypothetical protein IFHNHDMJ_00849 [Synechococcus sp. CBW1107]
MLALVQWSDHVSGFLVFCEPFFLNWERRTCSHLVFADSRDAEVLTNLPRCFQPISLGRSGSNTPPKARLVVQGQCAHGAKASAEAAPQHLGNVPHMHVEVLSGTAHGPDDGELGRSRPWPAMSDGRPTRLLVSDDNFIALQTSSLARITLRCPAPR